MSSESPFVAQSRLLDAEVESWRKTWKHRNPCEDWKQNEKLWGRGHCKHYANAEYKKFKKEIDSLFETTITFA